MQIIPVIDILNGQVVRGVAGERSKYEPVRSQLTDSSSPAVVLNAILETFEFEHCYVADLDAILHERLNHCALAELAQSGVTLTVDRGVRNAADVAELLELGADRVVVALETLPDRALAQDLLSQFGSQSLVLSLDLQGGRPMTVSAAWQSRTPETIAAELIEVGFRQLIVLDLASVGMNQGTPTLELCACLKDRFPDVSLTTGGGIRSAQDLRLLSAARVDGALVASALHNGQLCPKDCRL